MASQYNISHINYFLHDVTEFSTLLYKCNPMDIATQFTTVYMELLTSNIIGDSL